jgi:hypothetical protein
MMSSFTSVHRLFVMDRIFKVNVHGAAFLNRLACLTEMEQYCSERFPEKRRHFPVVTNTHCVAELFGSAFFRTVPSFIPKLPFISFSFSYFFSVFNVGGEFALL